MHIFDFDDYRIYLHEFIQKQPKRGWGWTLKIANALDMSSTFVSQMMAGDRELSLDQAYKLISLLQITEAETEYFLTLVEKARAETKELDRYFQKKLERLKRQSTSLAERLKHEKSLNEKDQAEFYSSYLYSAVRLQTAIDGFQSPEKLREKFQLSPESIHRISNFLLETGLCHRTTEGIQFTANSTHLPRTSPFIRQHHINLRMKTLEKSNDLKTEDLMFSSMVCVSNKDRQKIREILIQTLQNLNSIVDESASEKLQLLNLDWIEI